MNFPVLFQGGSGGKGGAGGKKDGTDGTSQETGTPHADGDTRGKTLLGRLFGRHASMFFTPVTHLRL
jgi:hypothetical protein